MTVIPSRSTGSPKTVAARATAPSFSAIVPMNLSAGPVFSKSIVLTFNLEEESNHHCPSNNQPHRVNALARPHVSAAWGPLTSTNGENRASGQRVKKRVHFFRNL